MSLLAAILLALAPPQHGALVPGRSLGGVRLGMTAGQVERAWGTRHGVCRDCARTTWYFTYRPFEPRGAGVELERGRVVAIFTLWSPRGWQTADGRLAIGDAPARITLAEGPLRSVACRNYAALVLPARGAVSAFYVVQGRLWGFGLTRRRIAICR